MKRILLGAAAFALAGPATAGGQLDTFKFTGQSTQIPGAEDVEIVPIFWDARCSSITYTVDTIPAVGKEGAAIPASVFAPEFQASFQKWNDIRTSYISMNVGQTRTIGNGNRRFDFINELTFETPAGSQFLASSPSTSLQEDATFAVGDDIDGDGDSDVFNPATAGRNSCYDHDNDGDIEFPAGFYRAGTILDNDVQFNNRLAPGAVWELTPSSTLATDTQSGIDIQAVATHEFGHSHGLAHSLINQISKGDGTGSTMFPFIDIDDRLSEVAQRSLHTDDIAWSSFAYQEGSASSGPGALQAGDVAFWREYGLITGSYKQDGFGVLGGEVAAISNSSKRAVVEAYSGKARAFSTNGFNVVVGPIENSIISDQYVIPVPKGPYRLRVEALDGDPAATGNISITAQIGGILNQHAYGEEFFGGNKEAALELRPGKGATVVAKEGRTNAGNNIITNRQVVLRNAGALTNIGTGAAIGLNDTIVYAERFSNAAVLAQLNAGATLTTALFRTGVFDASLVPAFKEAGVYLGRVNANATATLLEKLFADEEDDSDTPADFIGQDNDLAPLYLRTEDDEDDDRGSNGMQALRQRLAADPTLDLFAVLKAKTPQPAGDSGLPALLGLQVGTATGNSYLSVNGGALNPRTSNWIVELRFTPAN